MQGTIFVDLAISELSLFTRLRGRHEKNGKIRMHRFGQRTYSTHLNRKLNDESLM